MQFIKTIQTAFLLLILKVMLSCDAHWGEELWSTHARTHVHTHTHNARPVCSLNYMLASAVQRAFKMFYKWDAMVRSFVTFFGDGEGGGGSCPHRVVAEPSSMAIISLRYLTSAMPIGPGSAPSISRVCLYLWAWHNIGWRPSGR